MSLPKGAIEPKPRHDFNLVIKALMMMPKIEFQWFECAAKSNPAERKMLIH